MKIDKFLQDIPYIVSDLLNRCNEIHKRKTLLRLPVESSRNKVRIKIINKDRFELLLDYSNISIKAVYSLDNLGIELKEIMENGNNI